MTSTAPFAQVQSLCLPHGLMQMGGLHDEDGRTVVLIGTASGFWNVFTQSAEYLDTAPDPVDRWSTRILPQIAKAAGAADVAYPFGGPPYAPFISWAKATGDAWDSPTGMLVHAQAGMMISYRGALIFSRTLDLPTAHKPNPCDSCATRPCETACPVGALSPNHFYDVPACKSYLQTEGGQRCLSQGCAVRRACPISQSFDRPQAQSAHHMRAFQGEM